MQYKKVLTISLLSAFLLFIIIFAFFKTRDLIFGVKIREVNVVDGAKMPESVIEVRGNAQNAVKLYLNGREISIDIEGNFKETIALLSGYNRLVIQAEDKFGNTDEKHYQLTW